MNHRRRVGCNKCAPLARGADGGGSCGKAGTLRAFPNRIDEAPGAQGCLWFSGPPLNDPDSEEDYGSVSLTDPDSEEDYEIGRAHV